MNYRQDERKDEILQELISASLKERLVSHPTRFIRRYFFLQAPAYFLAKHGLNRSSPRIQFTRKYRSATYRSLLNIYSIGKHTNIGPKDLPTMHCVQRHQNLSRELPLGFYSASSTSLYKPFGFKRMAGNHVRRLSNQL